MEVDVNLFFVFCQTCRFPKIESFVSGSRPVLRRPTRADKHANTHIHPKKGIRIYLIRNIDPEIHRCFCFFVFSYCFLRLPSPNPNPAPGQFLPVSYCSSGPCSSRQTFSMFSDISISNNRILRFLEVLAGLERSGMLIAQFSSKAHGVVLSYDKKES